jgi:hypothetical protein
VSDAVAEEAPATDTPVAVELHGDLKTFVVGSDFGGDLLGQGTGAFRLRATLESKHLDLVAHHEVVAITGASVASLGVGLQAPELVDLTWATSGLDDSLLVRGRTDRLLATLHVGRLDVAVGRQPISFGSGLFFQPLDLVNPFLPATVDSEYKPGVDAVRADQYFGTSGQITAVAAAAGDLSDDGAVFALAGRGTVGVTDLQGFLGEVHGDEVIGASVQSAIGPVGVHGDATFTIPDGPDASDPFSREVEAPFVRAVIGADGRPHEKVSVGAEFYLQTFGKTDPAEYLWVWVDSERHRRGEVWAVGQLYAAASVAHEITPLVAVQGAMIANLRDPSTLVFGSLSWSVSDEASVAAGVITGVGKTTILTPQEDFFVRQRSEFGDLPTSAYVQMRAYF